MKGMSLSRIVLPAAALAFAVLAVLAVLDRLADNERAAERRALLMRAVELERSALTPGSVLPCVDGTSGETIGNACEKRVFASAQSAAAAVAYMGARIDLLSAAHALTRHGDKRVLGALASTRRAVALDRYGIAAHVLARRDGCTAKLCDVFAMLPNADALKANLKAQTFDQYVSRYAANWEAPGGKQAPATANGPAMSALPPAHPSANEARAEVTPPGVSVMQKRPPAGWHFPSADSIPAVSIMAPEPKLPRDLATRLDRDTAHKAAVERRKEGKEAKRKGSANDVSSQEAKEKAAETKQEEPGAPLQLTR